MFDTLSVGKRISALRKAQDMTQMELADRMGVSYQAVSNWERGNSMPDISKLPELAAIFNVTIDELLNVNSPLLNSAAHNNLDEYLKENKVTADELNTAAPLLKPSMFDTVLGFVQTALSDLAELAPFVSEEKLDQAVRDAEPDDAEALASLAPHLSSKTLRDCAARLVNEGKSIDALAPFMDSEDLGALAVIIVQQGRSFADIAPFMDEEDIGKAARILAEAGKSIDPYLPFMDEEDVGNAAQILAEAGKSIESYLPFMVEEDIAAIARILYEKNGVAAVVPLAPFMDDEDISAIARDAAGRYGLKSIIPLAPYIDEL